MERHAPRGHRFFTPTGLAFTHPLGARARRAALCSLWRFPLDAEPMAENVYIDILAQAKDYVYIATPYLAISNEMQTALCLAAKRGVDVRILTPGIPDKPTVFQLTRSYYASLC